MLVGLGFGLCLRLSCRQGCRWWGSGGFALWLGLAFWLGLGLALGLWHGLTLGLALWLGLGLGLALGLLFRPRACALA